MTKYYGKSISGTWSAMLNHTATNTTNTSVTISWSVGVHANAKHEHTRKYDTLTMACSDYSATHPSAGSGDVNMSKGSDLTYASRSVTYSRGHSARKIGIGVSVKHSGSGAKWKGTSGKEIAITIPAKPSYQVKYDANDPNPNSISSLLNPNPTTVPITQTKWYNEALTLSDKLPTVKDKRFTFKYWNEDITDTDATKRMYPSDTIPSNSNRAYTLYAIWDATFPPYCDIDRSISTSGYTITGKKLEDNCINGFSGISVDCTNVESFNDGEHDKTLVSASLIVGGTVVATKTTFDDIDHDDDGTYYDNFSLASSTLNLSAGTYSVYVELEDSEEKKKQFYVGDVTFVEPTWSKNVEVPTLPPPIVNGNAVLDAVWVKNFNPLVDAYELVSGTFPITVVSDDPNNPLWTFPYVFDANHVDNASLENPSIDVMVEFKHYDTYEKPYRQAFFNTTRNQNYSNGIYNVMFIGGVEDNPNYTSRVWWSQINNPLYFPDTNYIEVGSNDTMVMGLTKVGDYLAVIKQSKTTDTAIYLAYPTSFEEETTFAVRQGVQGVGALARYSFNILGDETLFLSPKGVMAIVPSQDEEHKVQNRSYFIDGRLLNEPNIDEAYSFVFDGMYYLAVNSVVYALDGNQRNSWGNDRTNLVYECYYLDNIPAKCFVKFKDRLAFSTYDEVCTVGDTYQDAYDNEDKDLTDVPVKAEWSTVLDDDGSLHYYKTMQKKGNLVSVLPLENEKPYKQVYIDEATFNENKTLYFTSVDGKYVRCKEDSVYDENTDYFVENRTNTRVFVKKDDKDEVEIERSFSLSSDIPSEMFLRKKFKKYKRLQFIIRNEAPEPFGVDSIIKNYTVGNYAKK